MTLTRTRINELLNTLRDKEALFQVFKLMSIIDQGKICMSGSF